MNMVRGTMGAAALALVLASWSALAAAEIEPGLPPNATVVLTVNVKQLLHASAVKHRGTPALQKAYKDAAAIHEAMAALGFDPFRDLDRATIALMPQGKKDSFVLIVHGRFDTARFHTAAGHLVKAHSDRLTVHKVDGLKIYSLVPTGGHGSLMVGAGASADKGAVLSVNTKGSLLDALEETCFALANKNTLIAAPTEAILKATRDRIAGKSGDKLNKPMRRLLADLDGKQTVVFAMRPTPPTLDPSETADSGAAKKDPEDLKPPRIKPSLFFLPGSVVPIPAYKEERSKPSKSLLDAPPSLVPPPPPPLEQPSSDASPEWSMSSLRDLSGSIALLEDFKLRCTLRTTSAADAKVAMKGFKELRLRMGGLATLLAGSSKNYAFLKEIPNSFLAVRKGSVILIEGHLSADTLDKLCGSIHMKSR